MKVAEVRGCCRGFTERIWGLVKLIKEVPIATLPYGTKNSKFSVVCEVLVFRSESIFVCPLWTILPGCVSIWCCSRWFTNRSIIPCSQERNSWCFYSSQIVFKFYSSQLVLTSSRCGFSAVEFIPSASVTELFLPCLLVLLGTFAHIGTSSQHWPQ